MSCGEKKHRKLTRNSLEFIVSILESSAATLTVFTAQNTHKDDVPGISSNRAGQGPMQGQRRTLVFQGTHLLVHMSTSTVAG